MATIDPRKDPRVYVVKGGRIEVDWLSEYGMLDDRHSELRRPRQNRRHNTRTFGKMVSAPRYDDYDANHYDRSTKSRSPRKHVETSSDWGDRAIALRREEVLRREFGS